VGRARIERNEDEVETSNSLKGGGGSEEGYPRARQHDYEPQLCLRRLPATQRSSGTVGYESSSNDVFGNNRLSFAYVNFFRATRAMRPLRA